VRPPRRRPRRTRSGLPAFAQVSASGRTVTVAWNAAPDDVAALARSLGLTDAPALTREQDAALAASDALERAGAARRDGPQGGPGLRRRLPPRPAS
jgi:hypothetical protein